MKKLVVIIIMLTLLSVGAGAYAQPPIMVFVDGRVISFPDEQPFVDQNKRTLVPLRFVAQEMGADVGWLANDRLVMIEKSDQPSLIDKVKNIRNFQDLLKEAQNLVNRILISLRIGESHATVNGQRRDFDTRPVVVGGRTMVPLRFISETLGADVEWQAATRTVLIWTTDQRTPPKATPFTGGTPTSGKEWIRSGQPAVNIRWGENPQIKHITVNDLPHQLTLSRDIIGITIDARHVNVTFRSDTKMQGVPDMFLAEGRDITRRRNATNLTELGNNLYLQKYNIRSVFDRHPDVGNLQTDADITKITHLIFEGGGPDGRLLLAVENPLFGGQR